MPSLDERGRFATDEAMHTSLPGIWAAGDARRGASLVVTAIREGLDVAEHVGTQLATLLT